MFTWYCIDAEICGIIHHYYLYLNQLLVSYFNTVTYTALHNFVRTNYLNRTKTEHLIFFMLLPTVATRVYNAHVKKLSMSLVEN